MPNKKSGEKLSPPKRSVPKSAHKDSFTPHPLNDFSPESDKSGKSSLSGSAKTRSRGAHKPAPVKKRSANSDGGSKRPSSAPTPPASLLTGKSTKRRSYGFRQNTISESVPVTVRPNLSPQLAPDFLRRQGRETKEGKTLSPSDHSSASALKVIPLGGLCEIGKNMTVYEHGRDMIVVDVGIAFPEDYQPGIDSVIPDMSYVLENRDRLRGIFITHGHEDHIGSLSWLLDKVSAPVFALPLTCELIKLKLEDKGLGSQCQLVHPVKVREHTRVGCFDVEFIHVNHSIADAAALAIRTPSGLAIHSGDFKIDFTPIHGEPIDLQRFAELGAEGVLLFVCESTNIERPGYTPSESKIGDAFATQFQKASGRIIVATFSSNVHRIQQIITAAEKFNRKVALAGRSMLNVFKAAQNLDYLDIRPDTLIELKEVDKYPPEKIVIITTGSQGEPLSALTRMAYSEHRNIEIGAGDTVIISATPIPGNEKPIFRVINELYKRQANVVYSALADIHVSGHAYQEEIKILHQLIKPRYFMPGHGEYRHLYMHAQLAHLMGQPLDRIYILNNGDIFECDQKHARIAGYTTAGAILIDGSPGGTVDSNLLNQRRTLSDDGVVAVSLAINKKLQELVGEPIIQALGFIYPEDMTAVVTDCRRLIKNFVGKYGSSGRPFVGPALALQIQENLKTALYQRTKRHPVVLVSVIEL